jgi:hypothetical protein
LTKRKTFDRNCRAHDTAPTALSRSLAKAFGVQLSRHENRPRTRHHCDHRILAHATSWEFAINGIVLGVASISYPQNQTSTRLSSTIGRKFVLVLRCEFPFGMLLANQDRTIADSTSL